MREEQSSVDLATYSKTKDEGKQRVQDLLSTEVKRNLIRGYVDQDSVQKCFPWEGVGHGASLNKNTECAEEHREDQETQRFQNNVMPKRTIRWKSTATKRLNESITWHKSDGINNVLSYPEASRQPLLTKQGARTELCGEGKNTSACARIESQHEKQIIIPPSGVGVVHQLTLTEKVLEPELHKDERSTSANTTVETKSESQVVIPRILNTSSDNHGEKKSLPGVSDDPNFTGNTDSGVSDAGAKSKHFDIQPVTFTKDTYFGAEKDEPVDEDRLSDYDCVDFTIDDYDPDHQNDLKKNLSKFMKLQEEEIPEQPGDDVDEEIRASFRRLGYLKKGGHLPGLKGVDDSILEDLSINEIEVDQVYGVVNQIPVKSKTLGKSKCGMDDRDILLSDKETDNQNNISKNSTLAILSPRQVQRRGHSADEQLASSRTSSPLISSWKLFLRRLTGTGRKVVSIKSKTEHWKLSREDRSRDHPGFSGVNLRLLHKTTSVSFTSNKLDPVPWDCEAGLLLFHQNQGKDFPHCSFVGLASMEGNRFWWTDEPSLKATIEVEMPDAMQQWKRFRRKDLDEALGSIMEPHKNVCALAKNIQEKEDDDIYSAEMDLPISGTISQDDEEEKNEVLDVAFVLSNTKIQS